ncbi:Cyclin-D-binding Myb-like transcription factor 1 [Smittium mucronatum]|uniref:Cyclin-D-binding Myb-like transcription factor 1 n=1 Tax=Smittium mucronatum TaxID=133383 RepID=A0A1R0GWN8_9FUNG|nr:Cyclin-D-binding Myb-like transcription factor 1 [Smittium mucronatum]
MYPSSNESDSLDFVGEDNNEQNSMQESSSSDKLTSLLLSVLNIIPASSLLKVFTESLESVFNIQPSPENEDVSIESLKESKNIDSFFSKHQFLMDKNQESLFYSVLEKNLEILFLQSYNDGSISLSKESENYHHNNKEFEKFSSMQDCPPPNQNISSTSLNDISIENAVTPFETSPENDPGVYKTIEDIASKLFDSANVPFSNVLPASSAEILSNPQIQNTIRSMLLDQDFLNNYNNINLEKILENHIISLLDSNNNSTQPTLDQTFFSQDFTSKEKAENSLSPESFDIPDSTEKLVAQFPGLISESVFEIAAALRQISNSDNSQTSLHSKLKSNSNRPHQLTQIPSKRFLSVNEKWLSSNSLKRLRQLYGVTYHKGRFTAEENLKINQAIIKVCTEKSWKREALLQFLFQKNPNDQDEYSGVWKQICESIPNRPVQAMYHHIKRLFNPKNYQGNWTPEQDSQLLFWTSRLGHRWEIIGRRMNRTGTNCRDRWRNIKPGNARQTGRWKSEEKEALKMAVVKARLNSGLFPTSVEFGQDIGVPWEHVSEILKTRNASQCRGKWISFSHSSARPNSQNQPDIYCSSSKNYTNPNFKNSNDDFVWTADLDLDLVSFIKKTITTHPGDRTRISWKLVTDSINQNGLNCSWKQIKSRWDFLRKSVHVPKRYNTLQLADTIEKKILSFSPK